MWEFPYSDSRGQLLYADSPRYETTTATCARVVKVASASYGGQVCVMPSFYYTWDKRDSRRDITCVFYSLADDVAKISKITNIYFGKVRYEWMTRTIS